MAYFLQYGQLPPSDFRRCMKGAAPELPGICDCDLCMVRKQRSLHLGLLHTHAKAMHKWVESHKQIESSCHRAHRQSGWSLSMSEQSSSDWSLCGNLSRSLVTLLINALTQPLHSCNLVNWLEEPPLLLCAPYTKVLGHWLSTVTAILPPKSSSGPAYLYLWHDCSSHESACWAQLASLKRCSVSCTGLQPWEKRLLLLPSTQHKATY